MPYNVGAYLEGVQIAELAAISFSGSAKPVENVFPKALGSLLRPGRDCTRDITLKCSWHIAGRSKTYVEGLHKQLHEQLLLNGKGDLVVHGKTYEDVTIKSNPFDNIVHNEYMVYSMSFEGNRAQTFFDAQVHQRQIGVGRVGYFVYDYTDNNGVMRTFTFPIMDNYEAASSAEYEFDITPRQLYQYGSDKKIAGGRSKISLECFIVEDEVPEMEAYMYNYLLGPLGKQGTLKLGSNIYNYAVMDDFNSESNVQRSIKYNVSFSVSLQC